MQKCSVWVQQAPPAAQWSRAGAAEPTLKGREADLTHRGCGVVRGTPISRQFTCRWVLKHNRFISHEEGKERCRTRLRPTQLSCLSFKPRAPQPPLQDDRRPESTFWHSCLSPVTAAARPPSVRTAATRSCCREFKHWPHGHPLSIHDRPGVQTAQLPPSERLAHLPERITL